MTEYAPFKPPPSSPIATVRPYTAGVAVSQSAVELADGRVLYVWAEGGNRQLVLCGYASSVTAFLSADASVTVDRTLFSITSTTRRFHGCCVSRGPDGNLYLVVSHALTSTITVHASVTPPTYPDDYCTILYQSTDEGDTWDYHATVFAGTTDSAPLAGTPDPVCGPVELVPGTSRWIVVAGARAAGWSYFGSPTFYSDDAGATWSMSTHDQGPDRHAMGSTIAWRNGVGYCQQYNDDATGRTARFVSTVDDGENWVTYQSVTRPDDGSYGGSWFFSDGRVWWWRFVSSTDEPQIERTVASPSAWPPVWPTDYETIGYADSNGTEVDGSTLTVLMGGFVVFFHSGRVFALPLRRGWTVGSVRVA